MNASTEPRQVSPRGMTGMLREYLSGRRGLILVALLVAAAGTYLDWGLLVAAGIAPILIALAPCAAMCALGFCMSKMGGKSCSNTLKDQTPRSNNSQGTPISKTATDAQTPAGVVGSTHQQGARNA
jgi:hypothetical protein